MKVLKAKLFGMSSDVLGHLEVAWLMTQYSLLELEVLKAKLFGMSADVLGHLEVAWLMSHDSWLIIWIRGASNAESVHSKEVWNESADGPQQG